MCVYVEIYMYMYIFAFIHNCVCVCVFYMQGFLYMSYFLPSVVPHVGGVKVSMVPIKPS